MNEEIKEKWVKALLRNCRLDRGKSMKNMLVVFGMAGLFTVPACGGNEFSHDTRGVISTKLSEAYCDRMIECDILDAEWATVCVRHERHHMCELFDVCEREETQEQIDDANNCYNFLVNTDLTYNDCAIAWFHAWDFSDNTRVCLSTYSDNGDL